MLLMLKYPTSSLVALQLPEKLPRTTQAEFLHQIQSSHSQNTAQLKISKSQTSSQQDKHAQLNHQIEVTSGVLAEQCSAKLSAFFKKRRQLKKALKQQSKTEQKN